MVKVRLSYLFLVFEDGFSGTNKENIEVFNEKLKMFYIFNSFISLDYLLCWCGYGSCVVYISEPFVKQITLVVVI